MTAAPADPDAVISRDLAGQGFELQELAQVQPYWTPERMAEAEALEFGTDPGESEESLLAEDAMLGAEQSAAAEFETVRVEDRSIFPFSAVGKLFMTFDGRDRFGTAWVIGERAVFTAGHCIYDELGDDAWADRILFVPQFHRGQEPVGRWTATSIHTLAGWATRGPDMRRYDMGGVILDRPIASVTGSIPWRANQPPAQAYVSIGYPRVRVSDQHPFDGQEMWRCDGRYQSGSNPIKMANNMTKGSSGGTWLVHDASGFRAAGLNSFRAPAEPLSVQSPRFSGGFLNLLAALG